MMHARTGCPAKHLELRPVAGHLRQNPLEALMQGEGDVDDLGGAVVGRDGLKAKGVAHNERGGVSWKAADVATVAEVYSPAPRAMMAYVELPARRRTVSNLYYFDAKHEK